MACQSPRWPALGLLLILSSAGSAQTALGEQELRVKLLVPLSTETNKRGDKITAQVVYPEEFRGDIVEGVVQESKSSGKLKGKSVLNFTFYTLHHRGRPIPIDARVLSVANSRGEADVDEEGVMVKKKSNVGKVVATTAIGAALGAIFGGGKGAAIGAGAGAAASLILIQVAAKAPKISFAPGSEFVLSVRERQLR